MIAPSMATAAAGDQIATTQGTEKAGTAITMRPVLSRMASSSVSSRISRRSCEAQSQSAQNAVAAHRKLAA